MNELEHSSGDTEGNTEIENDQMDPIGGSEKVPDVIQILTSSSNDLDTNETEQDDQSLPSENKKEENYQLINNKKWKAGMIVDALIITFCIIISSLLIGLFSSVGRFTLLVFSCVLGIVGLTIVFYGGAAAKYTFGVIVLIVGFGILIIGIYKISQFSPQSKLLEYKLDAKGFMDKYQCSCWDDVETPNECINITEVSCLEMTATKALIGFVTAAVGFIVCLCSSLYFTAGHKISKKEGCKNENSTIDTPVTQGYKRYIDCVDDPNFYKNTIKQKSKKENNNR